VKLIFILLRQPLFFLSNPKNKFNPYDIFLFRNNHIIFSKYFMKGKNLRKRCISYINLFGGLLFLSVTVLSVSCRTETGRTNAGRHPNIILILADDMGYSDVGCFGGEIHTPNLDKLGNNGIRFSQFYNTAKCFPTRASLMTGLYSHQVGMGRTPGKFEKNCVTIAQVLRDAGYRTLMSGKWHGTDLPVDMGFDRYYGLVDGAVNYWNPGEKRPGEPMPGRKTRMMCGLEIATFQILK
jgi:hypothetical protein